MQYIDQDITLKLLRLPQGRAKEFIELLKNRKIIATIIDKKNKEHEKYNVYSGVDCIYFNNLEDMKIGVTLAVEYNNISWKRDDFGPVYRGMLKNIDSIEKDEKILKELYKLSETLKKFDIKDIGDFFKDKFKKVAKEAKYNDSIFLISILSSAEYIREEDIPHIHMLILVSLYRANETDTKLKSDMDYISLALQEMFKPVLRHIAEYTPHSKWLDSDFNNEYEAGISIITTEFK